MEEMSSVSHPEALNDKVMAFGEQTPKHQSRSTLPASTLQQAGPLRHSNHILQIATKQKNNGQSLEEDLGHGEPKTEPPSADKTLLEEKVKLEEQLRETMEKYKRALADTENLRQRSQKLVEEAKLY
ncbi:hypothetical protein STEG23_000111, partial [Scotinomys teguina]